MPSFDVVSEVDEHELANAIDQTNREVSNRFDFKGGHFFWCTRIGKECRCDLVDFFVCGLC